MELLIHLRNDSAVIRARSVKSDTETAKLTNKHIPRKASAKAGGAEGFREEGS